MQENCIIFDTDEQYGKRLMCAISRHKNLPFGVQLFTRADEMEIYLEHHTADMMVVSETCCEYGAEKPCEKQAKKMLVLKEEQINPEIPQKCGKYTNTSRQIQF